MGRNGGVAVQTPTLGIIGCSGNIGRLHTQTIVSQLPEFRVKYVCDVMADAAQAMAQQLHIPRSTADYREILDDKDVDAVLICSWTATHVPCIIEAAQTGKHIFCEKPVDLLPEKIVAAIVAARENHVKLQVGFMKRFDPEYGRLKALMTAGAVGEPSIVRFSSRDSTPPPADYVPRSGGLFLDMTCHDFDLLRYLTESEVEEVSVFGAVRVAEYFRQANDVDTAVISFRLQNGAIGCIDNSRQTNYGYDQRVEVFGPKGCVIADHVKHSQVVALGENGIVADKPKDWYMDRYREAYVAELRHFFEVLVTDQVPRVTAVDGLRATLIANAARQSLEERRVVKVDYSLCET
jgi:myo-inositol 2-dehydrogenase / D-chiro-inositol 1-dehydrogenase